MQVLKPYKSVLFVLAMVAIAAMSGAGRSFFSFLSDARFSLVSRSASGSIVLVAIDPPSLSQIGVWPWPRSLHAKLLDKLREMDATDVVFDVDFSAHQSEQADKDFAESLKRAGGSVVLPSFVQAVGGSAAKAKPHVSRPLSDFGKNSWPAVANVAAGSDGLVRRYTLGSTIDGAFIPSIGAVLAGLYDARRGDFSIDFGIRADTVPIVSYVDVLNGAVPKTMLAGKKIIVGATAVELGDRFNVPNGKIIAGPLLQTLSAESLLQGRALSTSSSITSYLGLAVLLIVTGLARGFSARTKLLAIATASTGMELLATVCYAKAALLIDTSLWQIALAAYAAAIGLEELDLRDLLAKIAENRFRRIAVSLSDGLICADASGAITFCNPHASEIFGLGTKDMIGMQLGALLVPGEGDLLSACDTGALQRDGVGTCLLERQARRKSGETFYLEASASRWTHGDAHHYGFVLRDISERKREEARIRFLAEYDPLTKLANRSKLAEHIQRVLDAEGNNSGAVLALCIDGLKELNDTLGTEAGDKIICAVATVVTERFPSATLVARLNGDEFAIVLPKSDAVRPTGTASDLLSKEFAEIAVKVDDRRLSIRLSAGSTIFPEDGATATDLLGNVALALHEAKRARSGHVAYDVTLRQRIESVRQLEQSLKLAYERHEFELFYQPQMDFEAGRIVGAEALIRWRHPEKGLMPPGTFLPVLETMPLSDAVGGWVIHAACAQAAVWERMGHSVRVGINLSPALFAAGDLLKIVRSELDATRVSPSLIELEVTENILFRNDDSAGETLTAIRDLGVAIAFDDFGTGFASLTHLKRFPIDRLKIDQTFVRDMLCNADDRAIVSMITGLSKLLGMSTIAEGIEDADTAAALVAMGCEEGQGYHFGRPMPADEFFRMYLSGDAEMPGRTASQFAA